MNWVLLIQLLPQLFQTAMQAVKIVEEATGQSTEDAAQEVINHITPGAPNSPTLSAQNPT